MKSLIASALVLASLSAFSAGDKGRTLGDETSAMRSRIESSIRKMLSSEKLRSGVTGTVTHVEREFFFLQAEDAALKIFSHGKMALHPTDLVVVDVKPSIEGGYVVFDAESIKKIGSGTLPQPRNASAKDLVFVALSRKDRARDVNWRRVEVRGRAIGLTESGFAIDVNELPVTVVTDDVPSFLSDSDTTRPIVKVTGVAELILDQSAIIGRSPWVMGVKLYMSNESDVAIEPDIVYLANKHDNRLQIAVISAFVVLGALVLFFAGYGIRQARRRLRSQVLMTERKRMADDLHDTIEQHIVGAGMLLQLERTKEANDVLLRAKREMRDIVWGLKNDDMMRLSPSDMIREYVKDENRKGMYRIDCRLLGLPEHLDATKMRDLSLVLREAVGNAVKHGRAKKIAIVCDPTESGGWRLRVSNDGKLFDPASAPGVDEGHFGIEGMKSRARRLGAELSICADGNRTVLTLEAKR